MDLLVSSLVLDPSGRQLLISSNTPLDHSVSRIERESCSITGKEFSDSSGFIHPSHLSLLGLLATD